MKVDESMAEADVKLAEARPFDCPVFPVQPADPTKGWKLIKRAEMN